MRDPEETATIIAKAISEIRTKNKSRNVSDELILSTCKKYDINEFCIRKVGGWEKQYHDRRGVTFRIGNKVARSIPVTYLCGKLPKPVIGIIIDENGELVSDEGKYKTPIKNWGSLFWEIL